MQYCKKLPCVLLGHKLYVSKTITAHIKEYTCKRCHRELTTTLDGGLTRLTTREKERNKMLSKMYTTKLSREKKRLIYSAV